MRNWILIIIGLLMTAGCGMNPPPLAGPVSVTGKVVTNDGKAVGGVAVNLQPLENGYLKTIDVKPDGTFTVETHAGKYAYFFTPKTGTKAVPPQVANLVEANLERTVIVASGQEIVINLP
jgi:hypothetical protein